ncbi:hypothetical protein Mag101_07320 [Microbulbifer agarilyticus]|uniref:Uncharacterized protein n=1 Tax=Microbulbifer agarilyticus TaxID=260552 RepID=A0A1Q2M4K2_9GAMM|nr:hypothetical protein [Microbulbifer agarilyticus]AQQ67468.1 hypothetical protein Mag101_07320 [Microbulbifer agarilyticus]
MTVYLHPTVTSAEAIQQLQRHTGRIVVAESNGRRLRLVEPKNKSTLSPTASNDWPPFGGDAA